MQPKCVTDVDALFQAVENIMDDLDPDMACEVAQFCPRPALGAGTGPARLAVPAAVPAMRALFHSLVEQRPARVGDKESCDNCKVVVLQAVAIIQVGAGAVNGAVGGVKCRGVKMMMWGVGGGEVGGHVSGGVIGLA